MLCHSLKQMKLLANHVLVTAQFYLISVVTPQRVASGDLYTVLGDLQRETSTNCLNQMLFIFQLKEAFIS